MMHFQQEMECFWPSLGRQTPATRGRWQLSVHYGRCCVHSDCCSSVVESWLRNSRKTWIQKHLDAHTVDVGHASSRWQLRVVGIAVDWDAYMGDIRDTVAAAAGLDRFGAREEVECHWEKG